MHIVDNTVGGAFETVFVSYFQQYMVLNAVQLHEFYVVLHELNLSQHACCYHFGYNLIESS